MKKTRERSLFDLLYEEENKNSKPIQSEKMGNATDFSLITLDHYQKNFLKSDKLITASIHDNGITESFNKSDFHLMNILASLAQNHTSGEDVPDYLYVSASDLTKMLGITRQAANAKFKDSEGNTFTYIERRLISLTKRSFLIKEALIPVIKNGMYVRDSQGKVICVQEKNYYFNCLFSFSTVGKIKGSNVFKIKLAPIFYFYNNIQFLNQKMNGVAYTKINIELVETLNDHRAMRMYELIKVKSMGHKQGSFRVIRDELISILNIDSSRLSHFLNRIKANLEKVMFFTFEFEKVSGVSMVVIKFEFKDDSYLN